MRYQRIYATLHDMILIMFYHKGNYVVPYFKFIDLLFYFITFSTFFVYDNIDGPSIRRNVYKSICLSTKKERKKGSTNPLKQTIYTCDPHMEIGLIDNLT